MSTLGHKLSATAAGDRLLLTELMALRFCQARLKAIVQRRASIHRNERSTFQHDLSCSLWIPHPTESHNQSFNKDHTCKSAYHWPGPLHTHFHLTIQQGDSWHTQLTDEETKAQGLRN